MIELNYLKRKIGIALIVFVLALVAVFYPAQARETTVSFGPVSTNTVEAVGFSWEIYVYPAQGNIYSSKYMWLVDEDGTEIEGTRYSYTINCIKRGVNVAQGRDVFVEGDVIKFTGAFLRCDENVSDDLADFRTRVADWDISICDNDVCTVSADGLFVEAHLEPYAQEKPGLLLQYPLFDNRQFLVAVDQDRFGWAMPLTDANGIAISSSMTYNEYDWGNQIKRLYMEKYCLPYTKGEQQPIGFGPCGIRHSVNHAPFEVQQNQGYPTTYSYGTDENRFYVGRGGGEFGRFYGELQRLRFDPNSCGGCITTH